MPDIRMPDGAVVRFPDTMPREQITSIIQQKMSNQAEKPSAFQDVIASGAAGVARGASDLVGLPGTIADAMNAGGQWALRQGYQLATGKEPSGKGGAVERFFASEDTAGIDKGNPVSGSKVRGAVSTVTGGATDYQPYTTAGEYARTVGEFLPGAAAFGGGSLPNLARYGLVPALTSETAGQATEGTPLEPYARIGGALVGGAIGNRLGRSASQALPSARDIKKSAGYGDEMTATLRQARTTDQTYQKVVKDLWDDVRQAGTSHEVQQNFGRTLQNELKMVQKEGASLHSLERLRRALRSAGGGALDTPNRAIAERLIDKLDDAVEGLSASSIATSGETGRPVLDMLKEARGVYQTGAKAQLVETAMARAKDTASGFENGLRIEFRKLLSNPKTARQFTANERLAMQQVVRGNFKSNALRWLGGFGVPLDNGRNFLGSVMGGGAGAAVGSAVGGPVGAAVGGPLLVGVGTAAKAGSNAATRNAATFAEAMVKAGPKGSQAIADALLASRVAGRESLLRGGLQSLSAYQIPRSKQGAR